MPAAYLHNRKDFPALIRILEGETGILAGLIEKDYWIMHVLYGLQQQGFEFELKGGTSLSKGYGIIDRFSEDIDIRIQPPAALKVNENPRNVRPNAVASRKGYYDWLAGAIKIDGIVSVTRDTAFDAERTYNSGGIRLSYQSIAEAVEGVKPGILLEVGFDTVTPYHRLTISSWAYDRASAVAGVELSDNRAKDVACYHPGYTFVEKLQTIATKFRNEQEGKPAYPNLMRQYYDLYSLLGNEEVQAFIGTREYHAHKQARFPAADKAIPIAQNEAFRLSAPGIREAFRQRYLATAAFYYKGQPSFNALLARIAEHIERL